MKSEKQAKIGSKRKLAKFLEGDYVLFTRERFFEFAKLCLRSQGPRRNIKVLRNYVYLVDYLRTGDCDYIQSTRLMFYRNNELYKNFILSVFLSLENGMPVARLLRFVAAGAELFFVDGSKGFSASDDPLERLNHVNEAVPNLIRKLLDRKNTPAALQSRAQASLGL